MITHEIIGDDMQAVVITMAAGDEVRAEAGAMTYMTDGIEMDARMEGGLLGGLKRKFLAGGSLFLTFFRSSVQGAQVAFSGPYPGKILRMPLQNSAVLCQRDSFLGGSGCRRCRSRGSPTGSSPRAKAIAKRSSAISAARWARWAI